MENQAKIIELNFKDEKIKVQQHSISNQVIYRVFFSNKRQTLVLTMTSNDNAAHWWTSIPKGRQREAEEIGPLIADYIKANQP